MRVTEAALTAGTSLFVNTDTLLPAETSPYAASKARFRDWARAHVGGSPLCFVNLRIEQMYGPGDDESKFPSFVIAHCMRNAEEIKLSPGAQERDFVHVDDVVAAIALFVLDRPALGAGFHEFEIGCGVPVSLRSFAESVRELSGARTRLAFGALPYRPNEVMRCVANPSALRALGWRCRHDLQSGLRATLAAERAAS
jgi:nucleoside-diphosphate-sugar epimerase